MLLDSVFYAIDVSTTGTYHPVFAVNSDVHISVTASTGTDYRERGAI